MDPPKRARRVSLPARFEILFVRLYQRALSPVIGTQCRFHPTCSQYAIACLEAHGAVRGTVLTIRRLMKCHPWGAAGVDHPPDPGV